MLAILAAVAADQPLFCYWRMNSEVGKEGGKEHVSCGYCNFIDVEMSRYTIHCGSDHQVPEG